MTEDTFKLPGSSYEEISKIIQAYGKLSKPASLEDVSQTVKMHTTVVSRNNAFLFSVGIIDNGKLKTPTEIGKNLARAMEYERTDQISKEWRVIVNRNEFLIKMLSAISIRKSMDVTTFQSHIAYSAGQTKSSRTLTGARAIIDILKIASLINEKDGQLFPSDSTTDIIDQTLNSENNTGKSEKPEEKSKELIERIHVADNYRYVSVSVQINLDVKPDDLEGLGEKVRALLKELSGDIINGDNSDQ